MTCGDGNLRVPELSRDVSELDPGTEKLAGEGVSEILVAALPDPGPLEDAPPLSDLDDRSWAGPASSHEERYVLPFFPMEHSIMQEVLNPAGKRA